MPRCTLGLPGMVPAMIITPDDRRTYRQSDLGLLLFPGMGCVLANDRPCVLVGVGNRGCDNLANPRHRHRCLHFFNSLDDPSGLLSHSPQPIKAGGFLFTGFAALLAGAGVATATLRRSASLLFPTSYRL